MSFKNSLFPSPAPGRSESRPQSCASQKCDCIGKVDQISSMIPEGKSATDSFKYLPPQMRSQVFDHNYDQILGYAIAEDQISSNQDSSQIRAAGRMFNLANKLVGNYRGGIKLKIGKEHNQARLYQAQTPSILSRAPDRNKSIEGILNVDFFFYGPQGGKLAVIANARASFLHQPNGGGFSLAISAQGQIERGFGMLESTSGFVVLSGVAGISPGVPGTHSIGNARFQPFYSMQLFT